MIRELRCGPGVILFLPLLYGFAIGALFNPNVTRWGRVFFRDDDLAASREMIVVAILPFVARFGATIGPAFGELMAAGPALILQELGNLATMLVALPVAVLVLGMGREAIGATYSIAREPNIAIFSDRYGSPGPKGPAS